MAMAGVWAAAAADAAAVANGSKAMATVPAMREKRCSVFMIRPFRHSKDH
jgi:hypothetical protein